MCSSLIRDMNEYGVCVMDNFIGPERGAKVLQEVNSMYSAGYFKVKVEMTNYLSEVKAKYFFKDGQLVASKDKINNRNIRGDKIMWIDGRETGVSNIKFLMNQVNITTSYLMTLF